MHKRIALPFYISTMAIEAVLILNTSIFLCHVFVHISSSIVIVNEKNKNNRHWKVFWWQLSGGLSASISNCLDRKCQSGTQSMLCLHSRRYSLIFLWQVIHTDVHMHFLSSRSLSERISVSPRAAGTPKLRNHLDFIHVHTSQVHLQWPTLCFSYFILLKRKIAWARRSLYPKGIHPLT